MSTAESFVEGLRQRWQPQKERLKALQSDHPTVVRFHRACSWLTAVEALDPTSHADVILLHQWIAFNALYGQWDASSREPAADRTTWQSFLSRLVKIDRSQHIVSTLQEHKPLVLRILENAYLSRYFWQDPSEKSAGKARATQKTALGWYVSGDWFRILDQLVERIYLLRCQLAHGAATCGGKLNRTALKHCTIMMTRLLPAVLNVWIDHGADEDWGPMCYPPLGSRGDNSPRASLSGFDRSSR